MAAASALAPLLPDGGLNQEMREQARKRKQQTYEEKRQGTRKSVRIDELEKLHAELERLRMAREDADTILSADSIFLLDLAEREQLRMEREDLLVSVQRLSARLHWHEQARDWVSAIGRDFWNSCRNHQNGCGFLTLVEFYRSARHFNLLSPVGKNTPLNSSARKIWNSQFCIVVRFFAPKDFTRSHCSKSSHSSYFQSQ